jgi:hypothetical protein
MLRKLAPFRTSYSAAAADWRATIGFNTAPSWIDSRRNGVFAWADFGYGSRLFHFRRERQVSKLRRLYFLYVRQISPPNKLTTAHVIPKFGVAKAE